MNATTTIVNTSPITVPSNTAANTSAVESTTASTTRVGTESTLVNINATSPVALTAASNATSKTTVTSVTTAAMSTIGPNSTNVTLPIVLGTSSTTTTATMTPAAPNSSTVASTSASLLLSPATSNTTAANTAVGSATTSTTTLPTNSTTVTALTNQSTSTAVTQLIVNSPTSYTTIISTVSSSTASTTNATVTPASTISSISPVTSPTTSSTSTTVSNSGTTPTSNGTTTQSTTNVITSSISLTPSSATTVSTTSVPTTTAIVVPGLVKNLTLTSQGVKNTSLEVVWLAAEGYVEQYIAFISPQEASAVSVSPTGSLTARFSGLRPGVEYTITVKTFGRGNVSNAGVSVKQVTALNTCNLACTNGQCFIDAKTSMSTCYCNSGFSLTSPQICSEKRLFEYGPTVGDTTIKPISTDSVSQFFSPPYGFPFASKFYQRLYFTDNGLIIFKDVEDSTRFAYPNPFINGFTDASSIPMIAVFWDDADFSSDTGAMYFQEYDFTEGLSNKNDALNLRGKVMDQIRANFSSQSDTRGYEPTWMLKITWVDAPAVPARSNLKYTNTFQAVLSTDGDSSFCLIFFKDGGMQWRPEARDPGSNNALMGFNSGTNRFYYNDALSRSTNPARYRPDTVIGNNTGLTGRWAYRLDTNLAVTTNPKRKCMDWYRNESVLPSISRFTTCPCSLWQGQFDMSYINGDLISRYGYQPLNVTGSFMSLQNFNKDLFGGGVRCHYNTFGALVSGSYERYLPTPWNILQPDIQLYSTNEVQPYQSCCQSGDARFCSRYQQKRPPNKCAFYRPPFAAFLIGDPHITTLDNVSYTFNGLGEYTVLEAVGDGVNFTMQGRTGIARTNASANISSKATSFIAIVAQETGGIKVEWILKNGSILVLVDGKQIDSTDDIYRQNVSIKWTIKGGVVATFASGISVNVSSLPGALNFITSLQESFNNCTKGLLGVFNKDPTDDFQASNGTVLRFNGSSVPPESQIYYSFGVTWQTKESTSLFTYNATSGETWSTFNNNNSFVPTFYEELINQTSAERLASIKASCGGQFDCIFDVLSTGDTDFGLATLKSAMEFGSQQKALQNFPPNITSDGQISAKLNQVVTVNISAVDPNNDAIVITISGNSSDLNITADGTLTWSPRSSEPAFGVVSASNGKASSLLLLNLTLCNCSAHSTCLYNQTTLSITGSDGSTFQVAGCQCDDGYAGAYCMDDYNACVDSPCHPGVNCTDDRAPSLGFSCGPCPVGLTGNGSKCYDVDECLEVPAKCNQTCLNNNHGYTCSCDIGYINTTIDSSMCQDINECATQNTCHTNATCSNNEGSYNCICKQGFTGDGRMCSDIDECLTNCTDQSAQCVNTIGSYLCSCAKGYTSIGDNNPGNGINCGDIDECKENGTICGPNATCSNNLGSYSCSCVSGYEMMNNTCLDINECESMPCPQNEECYNIPGTYKCNCSDGYKRDGQDCVPLNCSQTACIAGYCKNGGTCYNTPFCNASCTCLASYEGIDCQYGKTTVNASFKAGTPKLKVFMGLNYNISPTPTDQNQIKELASAKIVKKLEKLFYFNYFYNNSITNISLMDNNVFFVKTYAQFNYTTESAVYNYYKYDLKKDIETQFTTNTRAVDFMVLVNLTTEQLSLDELKQYIDCSTTMPNYVPKWIDGTGFVCQSPCITEIYCKNGGKCQHTSNGPVCECSTNGIYHFDGDQCQHLTVTSPAFFGILFGSLGGMLLLGIGIYAFWRYKSGRTYSLFGNKGSYPGSHQGGVSAYDNYSREGAIKGTHAAETEVYGVKSDLAFTSWRPVIHDINTTEVSIQRPSVLKGRFDSEQAYHDLE
ncbi:mucin-4 [Lampetra fluviatilis]